MTKKLKILIITAIGIFFIGLYFLQKNNQYNTFTDVIEKINLSDEQKSKNILEKFSEKKEFTYNEQVINNELNIAVTNKFNQGILYQPGKKKIQFKSSINESITKENKAKIKHLNKGDTIKETILQLGNPDIMMKDETGKIVMTWGGMVSSSVITFENKKVVKIEVDD